jgi:hypothetical protein
LGSEVGELRVALQERELHRVGGAVAVLGQDHFREPLLIGLVVVVLVPIDEGHKVRVLLDAVVDGHVLGDEVVQSVDGQVVDVVLAVRLDRDDAIPEDVTACEVAEFFRVHDLGDACRPLPAQAGTIERRAAVLVPDSGVQLAGGDVCGRHGRAHDRLPCLSRKTVSIRIGAHRVESFLDGGGAKGTPLTNAADRPEKREHVVLALHVDTPARPALPGHLNLGEPPTDTEAQEQGDHIAAQLLARGVVSDCRVVAIGA